MLTIKFELPESEWVEVVPIGDVHIGNPLCDEAEFKKTVDYILEEPNDPKGARICLLNGDLTESVTRTSKGNAFDMVYAPSVQVALMTKYLLPLTETSKKYPQGKILSYCAGNHDYGRYNDTGISSAETIAVNLGLQDRFSTDGCYSFIYVQRIQDTKGIGRTVHTLYNQHLTGGSSTVGGKANRVSKVSNGVIADVIVGSHVHLPMTFKEDIIIPNPHKGVLLQNTITYLITNAYLRYGDYAQRSSMKPSTISVPSVYLMQGREVHHRDDKRFTYTEVKL